METTYETIISFGKHDWNGCGRKINLCTLELRLEREHNTRYNVDYWRFACRGAVWNSKGTDLICAGQCIDDMWDNIEALRADPLFREIHELWKKYHLNDMHAGTPRQEALLEQLQRAKQHEMEARGIKCTLPLVFSYDEATQILKEQGYYIDTHYGQPFEYGKGWAPHEIPEDTVCRIIEIIEENQKKINASKIL